MANEIERKYFVLSDSWKQSDIISVKDFTQGYMTVPGVKNQPEARVRIATPQGSADQAKATLTFKGKGTLTRKEVEKSLDMEAALDLLAMCEDRVLYKTRTCVSENGKTWEIDVYSGPLAGLVVAEVELGSKDERISLPSWVGVELTEDNRFKNANLIGVRWDGQDLVSLDSSSPAKKIKP